VATARISDLKKWLDWFEKEYGDMPVVLWDLDTGTYSSLEAINFEIQEMADGSKRLSVGLNDWEGTSEESPSIRPIKVGL